MSKAAAPHPTQHRTRAPTYTAQCTGKSGEAPGGSSCQLISANIAGRLLSEESTWHASTVAKQMSTALPAHKHAEAQADSARWPHPSDTGRPSLGKRSTRTARNAGGGRSRMSHSVGVVSNCWWMDMPRITPVNMSATPVVAVRAAASTASNWRLSGLVLVSECEVSDSPASGWSS